MQDPSGHDLYQWNEAGYFGIRYTLYTQRFADKLGPYNIAVYQCILAHTDRKTGQAVISVRELSKATGIRDLHIIVRCLKTLEQWHFISSQKKARVKSRFWPLHEKYWTVEQTTPYRKIRSDKGKPRRRNGKPITDYAQQFTTLSEGERLQELRRQQELLRNKQQPVA